MRLAARSTKRRPVSSVSPAVPRKGSATAPAFQLDRYQMPADARLRCFARNIASLRRAQGTSVRPAAAIRRWKPLTRFTKHEFPTGSFITEILLEHFDYTLD